MRHSILFIAVWIATLPLQFGQDTPRPNSSDLQHEANPLVVFLVRHAEKASSGADPVLTAAGRERSRLLAQMLRSVDLDSVHSSDFARTKLTAQPAVATHGLQVQLYDPSDLPTIADRLRSLGGTHLVVGHSNTTPRLVALLGGKPGEPIHEPTEYDRLYVITVGADGTVHSIMLRYGEPYLPGLD